MNQRPAEAVSAVIILPDGKWVIQSHTKLQALTLPSGKLEPGELPIKGIIRELKEELNVEVVKEDFLASYTIRHEECVGKDGYIEHRFVMHVPSDFKYENAEPEKHPWIRPMSIEEIREHELPTSIILTDLLHTHRL